jgi:hypothetical protein
MQNYNLKTYKLRISNKSELIDVPHVSSIDLQQWILVLLLQSPYQYCIFSFYAFSVHNINAYGEDLSSDLGPETDYPD